MSKLELGIKEDREGTAAYAPAVLAHCRGRKLRRAKEDGKGQKSRQKDGGQAEVRGQMSEDGKGRRTDVRSRKNGVKSAFDP